jgi:hypothetical protein
MNPEKILECSFLIPLHRDQEISDGNSHKPVAWDWLRHELYDRFDGWTLAPDVYEGMWKSPSGLPIADQSRKYIVAIPESKIQNLRTMVADACVQFQQQMIYLSIAGQVEFIKPPTTESTNE